MYDRLFLSIVILSILIIFPGTIYGKHIFTDVNVFAESLDIVQLSSEKFILTVNDVSYDMYYGYHGSFDSMASNELQPKLSFMLLDQEKKSLEITFDSVPTDSIFWVRMPDELISAENDFFQVFVDGKKTKYELIQFPNDMSLGIIMPQDGQHVEIIGTRVIPEFGVYVILILGISTFGTIYFVRNTSLNHSF